SISPETLQAIASLKSVRLVYFRNFNLINIRELSRASRLRHLIIKNDNNRKTIDFPLRVSELNQLTRLSILELNYPVTYDTVFNLPNLQVLILCKTKIDENLYALYKLTN